MAGIARPDLIGARENNLKGIDVGIPLGVMTCITGVSGIGKSSLVPKESFIRRSVGECFMDTGVKPGDFERLAATCSG